LSGISSGGYGSGGGGGSSATLKYNALGGTVTPWGTDTWEIVVHRSSSDTNYRLPASPTDGWLRGFLRDPAGTGRISIDGNGRSVLRGLTSSATWGPSAALNDITARYDATYGVWRLE
jgi:hypothetical protein